MMFVMYYYPYLSQLLAFLYLCYCLIYTCIYGAGQKKKLNFEKILPETHQGSASLVFNICETHRFDVRLGYTGHANKKKVSPRGATHVQLVVHGVVVAGARRRPGGARPLLGVRRRGRP